MKVSLNDISASAFIVLAISIILIFAFFAWILMIALGSFALASGVAVAYSYEATIWLAVIISWIGGCFGISKRKTD